MPGGSTHGGRAELRRLRIQSVNRAFALTLTVATGNDLTGRPLQLHGFGELLPATLTDRFVGAFVVVPASRFRWIVSAAEGTF